MADPRYIVFDMDGTLLDTRGDIVRAVNVGLSSVGLPHCDPARIISFVGDGMGRLVDRSVVAVGGDKACSPEVVKALVADYRAHPMDDTRPYPGVETLLAALFDRGLPMAVASNKLTELCHLIIGGLGWERYFQVVLGGDWGGGRKPDPSALLEAARSLALPPQQGLMVGDSAVDMQAAQAAGLRAIGVSWGYRSRADLAAGGAEIIIDQATELIDLLGP